MSSNIIVGKPGFTSVTVHTISVKDNSVNQIMEYNRLRTTGSYSEGYLKYFLDFLKITRTLQVTGYIATEQDGSTTAETLRTRLFDIFGGGGEMFITYLGSDIIGPMTGIEFREVPADHSTARFFLVTFSLLVASKR